MEIVFYNDLRRFPELRCLASDEERKEAVAAYYRRPGRLRDKRTWIPLVIYAALILPLSLCTFTAFKRSRVLYGWPPQWAAGLVLGLVSVGLLAGIGYTFGRAPFRKFIREYLLARGIPICARCRYDLRGQAEARCPECGKRFDPGLLVHTSGEAGGESRAGTTGSERPDRSLRTDD